MFLKNEQQLRCVQEQKVNISESFVLYEGKYTGLGPLDSESLLQLS